MKKGLPTPARLQLEAGGLGVQLHRSYTIGCLVLEASKSKVTAESTFDGFLKLKDPRKDPKSATDNNNYFLIVSLSQAAFSSFIFGQQGKGSGKRPT